MSITSSQDPLQLPATLQQQLQGFRRRVWTVKMTEAVGAAVFAIVVSFLALFAFDRIFDTPWWLRLALFFAALAGCAVIPLCFHRWIWRRRRPEQLARLLSDRLPHLGDHLLG
ncbi:MAG: hypothetical protein JJ992_20835, partial [Planctomycetes bacterium]|nr:hypothetical protein [Planctomycetota bacterium]